MHSDADAFEDLVLPLTALASNLCLVLFWVYTGLGPYNVNSNFSAGSSANSHPIAICVPLGLMVPLCLWSLEAEARGQEL